MRKTRVLLADDHQIVLEGLKNLLEPEFELVGTVTDGRALVNEALKLNEGCRLLEEAAVTSYELIDKVLLKGTFTPGPFMQGKEKYKEWAKKLDDLSEKSGLSYLKSCEMMKTGRFLSYK